MSAIVNIVIFRRELIDSLNTTNYNYFPVSIIAHCQKRSTYCTIITFVISGTSTPAELPSWYIFSNEMPPAGH